MLSTYPGPPCISEKSILMEWMYEFNIVSVNRGSTPTFSTATRQEVLDVTMSCSRMEPLISSWRVSQEESLSDHKHILYDVAVGPKVQGTVASRNPRATNWPEYKVEQERNLPQQLRRLNSVGEVAKITAIR